MKKEQRRSYGVIPLYRSGQGVEILLIRQKHRDIEYWTFSKGTPEDGEEPRATAIRETREEVGIVCGEIDPDFLYVDRYEFEEDGQHIEKTVTYYIGRTHSKDVHPQDAEVADYAWLPLHDAKEKLTYEGGKKVIDAIENNFPHSRLFDSK